MKVLLVNSAVDLFAHQTSNDFAANIFRLLFFSNTHSHPHLYTNTCNVRSHICEFIITFHTHTHMRWFYSGNALYPRGLSLHFLDHADIYLCKRMNIIKTYLKKTDKAGPRRSTIPTCLRRHWNHTICIKCSHIYAHKVCTIWVD